MKKITVKNIAMLFALMLCILPTHHSHAGQKEDLQLLLTLVVGEFDNARQVSEQDDADEKTDYSRLFHKRELIQSKELDGHWVFAQINKGGPTGSIYRQSYLNFLINDDGEIVSRNYKLKQLKQNEKQQEKKYPSPEFLSTLSLQQLKSSLFEGCDTYWVREIDQFIGVTRSEACVIDSKYKDEKRRIFSREILSKSEVWALEGAYRLDGGLAFGLEPPNYYKYERIHTVD